MARIKVKYDHDIMEQTYKGTWQVDGLTVIIDPDNWQMMATNHWHIKYSHSIPYVVRKSTKHGKTKTIRLHREIMATPEGMETHHKNRNSLDNRRENLVNVTPERHRQIKFDPFID